MASEQVKGLNRIFYNGSDRRKNELLKSPWRMRHQKCIFSKEFIVMTSPSVSVALRRIGATHLKLTATMRP